MSDILSESHSNDDNGIVSKVAQLSCAKTEKNQIIIQFNTFSGFSHQLLVAHFVT